MIVVSRLLLIGCSIIGLADAQLNTSKLPCANITEYVIGYTGEIEADGNMGILAVALVDLQLQMNFNPAMQMTYGPIAMSVPNLNPCFRIRPIIQGHGQFPGDAGNREKTHLNNTLNFALGLGGVPKCLGAMGMLCDECQTGSAALASARKMPYAAVSTVNELSDKDRYPYFFRQAAPAQIQGDIAMWYIKNFKFRSVAIIYSTSTWGQEIFQRISNQALVSNDTKRILAYAFPYYATPQPTLALDIVQRVKWAPTRLICLMDETQYNVIYDAMMQEGVWMPKYQIISGNFHTEAAIMTNPSPAVNKLQVLAGTTIHWIYGTPDLRNAIYSGYLTAYYLMPPSWVWNNADRYMLNNQPPLAPWSIQQLDNSSFQKNPATLPLWDQTYLAMVCNMFYTYVHAINKLLNDGVDPADVQGEPLRAAMAAVQFPGPGNMDVNYDQDQDVTQAWGVWQTCVDINFGQTVNGTPLPQHPSCSGIPAVGPITLSPWSSGKLGYYFVLPGAVVGWGNGVRNNTHAPPELTECQPGMLVVLATGTCDVCVDGSVSTTLNAVECTPCAPGKFAELNKSTCTDCAPGRGTSESGSTACAKCPKGFYSPGGSGCMSCPEGTFSDQSLTSECTSCNGILDRSSSQAASTSPEQCVCPAGLYRERNNGTCVECPKFMECQEGSNMDYYWQMKDQGFPAGHTKSYPILEKNYWSSPDEPLSIFVCNGEVACPGGTPGTCAQYMSGQSCGICVDNYYRTSEGCFECSGAEVSPLLFPITPLVIVPPMISFLYFMFRDMPDRWETPQNLFTGLVLILLCHYQSVAVISLTNVDWPKSSADTFESFEMTNDAMSIFHIDCVGISGFKGKYISQISVPFVLLFFCFWTFFLTVVLAMCCGLKRIRMDGDRLCNVYFSLIYTFFAGIANSSMKLFHFVESPNGELALASDASVLQDSTEWTSLLAMGICALTLECLAVVVLFLYITCKAPTSFQFPYFQKRWKFLFIKYRPDVYWWGVPLMMRGVVINLGLVLLVTGARQLYWIYFAVMVYTAGVIKFCPWRLPATNGLDILSSLSVATVAAFGTWFAVEEGFLSNDVEHMMIGISFGAFAIFIGATAILVIPRCLGKTSFRFRRSHSMQCIKQVDTLRQACRLVSALDKSEVDKFYLNHLATYDRFLLNRAAVVIMQEFRIVGAKARLVRESSALLGHQRSRELEYILKGSTNTLDKNEDEDTQLARRATQAKTRSENNSKEPIAEKCNSRQTEETKASSRDDSISDFEKQKLLGDLPMIPDTENGKEQKLVTEVPDFPLDMPYENSPKASGWTCTMKPLAIERTIMASTPHCSPKGSPRSDIIVTPKLAAVTPMNKPIVTPTAASPKAY